MTDQYEFTGRYILEQIVKNNGEICDVMFKPAIQSQFCKNCIIRDWCSLESHSSKYKDKNGKLCDKDVWKRNKFYKAKHILNGLIAQEKIEEMLQC